MGAGLRILPDTGAGDHDTAAAKLLTQNAGSPAIGRYWLCQIRCQADPLIHVSL